VIYDAKIIEEFATRLYRKAVSVVWQYTALGAIVGLFVGVGIDRALTPADDTSELTCGGHRS
jgi:hypothetical protein